ncbi:RAD50-interacting protein 1 [Kappamyces sp. JEL0680]|nr:RAD50-interacting protein 1 [Kappamyces sp. JEL0680]
MAAPTLQTEIEVCTAELMRRMATKKRNLIGIKTNVETLKEKMGKLNLEKHCFVGLETTIRLQGGVVYSKGLASLYALADTILEHLEQSRLHKAIEAYNAYHGLIEELGSQFSTIQLDYFERVLGSFAAHQDLTMRKSFHAVSRAIEDRLCKKLKAMSWPRLDPSVEIDAEFVQLFTWIVIPPPAKQGALVYPLQTMPCFDALALHHRQAFAYHFKGKKKTNQLDKPEYYLEWTLKTLHEQEAFLQQVVQVIFDQAESESDWSALGRVHIIAMHEFIASLLRPVFDKVRSNMAKLMDQPAIFSHTLSELLKFDKILEESYLFDTFPSYGGTAAFILADKALLETWLELEYQEGYAMMQKLLRDPSHLALSPTGFIPQSAQTLALYLFDSKGTHLQPPYRQSFFARVLEPVVGTYRASLLQILESYQSNFYPISDKQAKDADFSKACAAFAGLDHIHDVLWELSTDSWFLGMDPASTVLQGLLQTYGEAVVLLKWMAGHGFQQNTSSELLPALGRLEASLQPVATALALQPKTKLLQALGRLLDAHLYDRVLAKGAFSPAGVEQLERDMLALAALLGSNSLSVLPKVRDCLLLWTLPMDSELEVSMAAVAAEIQRGARIIQKELGLQLTPEQVRNALQRFTGNPNDS